jgi:type I restriction enzyme, S subunit
MAGEWRTMTVDDIKSPGDRAIAIGPFGSRMKADVYVAEGVPVIRGNNISDTRALVGDFVYVSNETADDLRACNVYADDLVFPHRGSIGQVGIVPASGVGRYILSSSLMKLTCDKHRVEPRFVFYFFRSEVGRHALLQHASTVGTPGIGQPLTSLRSIRLRVPPLSEQRAIAHILSTLDDKIELNRRMNKTLEEIARTLFKSWFIDFDPVRAKAAGRDPALPKHLVDLFPDSFEDSDLAEIPMGWRLTTIGNLSDVVGGSTPSTKEPSYWEDGEHYWATPKDLSSLSVPALLETERSITDAGVTQISSGLLPMGTLLLSSRAPIGYLAIAEVPVAINQGFIAMKPKPEVSNLFLLFWAEFSHETILSRANGSTFLEISKGNFRPIPVIAPTKEVMAAFEERVRPVYQRIVENERDSCTLAVLRDALLPKLVSGELRISDPERIGEISS